MPVSLQGGRAVTVVLNPPGALIRTPAGTGGIPKRSFRDYGNEH